MFKILKFSQNYGILIACIIVMTIIFFPIDESYSSSCPSFVSIIWDKFEYKVNDNAELTMINPNCNEEKLFVSVTSFRHQEKINMTLTEKIDGVFKGNIKFVNSTDPRVGELPVWEGDTVMVDYLGTKIKVTILGTLQIASITFSNENGEPFSFNDSNITINGNVIESDENKISFSNNTKITIDSNESNEDISGDEECKRGIEFNLIDDIECIIAKKIDPTYIITFSNENGEPFFPKDLTIKVNGKVEQITQSEITKPINTKIQIKEGNSFGFFETYSTSEVCKIGMEFNLTDNTKCTITKTVNWKLILFLTVILGGGTGYVLYKNNGTKPKGISKSRDVDIEIDVNVELKLKDDSN